MRRRRTEARGGVTAEVARAMASQYVRLVNRPGRPPAWEARITVDGVPRVCMRSCKRWGSNQARVVVENWLQARLGEVIGERDALAVMLGVVCRKHEGRTR